MMIMQEKLMFYQRPFTRALYTTSGFYEIDLSMNTYAIICRGGGGAGGAKGYQPQYTSGNGGAGAKGDLTYTEVTISKPTKARIYVGAAGRAGGNGNGGKGGGNGGRNATGADGGLTGYCGGGGGKPSYVAVDGSAIAYADGGGGGGAGGNTNAKGRYVGGIGGAGGGGYYRFHPDTLEIESVPGKNGAGGVPASDSRLAPRPAVAGNMDFPELYSGVGTSGKVGLGADGAFGGGASSGSGGHGASNDDYNSLGASGGAAGGSPDAGGGQGGTGGSGTRAGNGYNHHTTPTDTYKDNAGYGVIGTYGIGGSQGQDGTDGFVLILPLEQNIVSKTNLGLINEEAEEVIDCDGLIAQPDSYKDNGSLGQTEQEIDYGTLGLSEEQIDNGNVYIPTTVDEIINNGAIYE